VNPRSFLTSTSVCVSSQKVSTAIDRTYSNYALLATKASKHNPLFQIKRHCYFLHKMENSIRCLCTKNIEGSRVEKLPIVDVIAQETLLYKDKISLLYFGEIASIFT